MRCIRYVLHQTKITELMYYDNEANSLAAKYVDIYDNDNLVDEIFSESLYYDE